VQVDPLVVGPVQTLRQRRGVELVHLVGDRRAGVLELGRRQRPLEVDGVPVRVGRHGRVAHVAVPAGVAQERAEARAALVCELLVDRPLWTEVGVVQLDGGDEPVVAGLAGREVGDVVEQQHPGAPAVGADLEPGSVRRERVRPRGPGVSGFGRHPYVPVLPAGRQGRVRVDGQDVPLVVVQDDLEQPVRAGEVRGDGAGGARGDERRHGVAVADPLEVAVRAAVAAALARPA
jgi:hypothetical protein